MLLKNSLLRRALTMKRHRTLDREATPVLTAEQIGAKRARTPEGYLVCMDVPVARVGEMLYAQGEIPLQANSDGIIRVTRSAEDLFSPQTLASFQGKPVVDEHPDDDDVRPENWNELAIGVTLNPRRGEGDDADCIVAELLITNKGAIRDIEDGKREVSAGYEADYVQTGPGTGRQTNIIGNHIALVEKGRCGPRCAIGDHQPKELQGMGTKTTTVRRRTSVADAVRKAFRDAENAAVTALTDEGPESGESAGEMPDGEGAIHVHVHSGDPGVGAAAPAAGSTKDDDIEARFQSLEAGHAELNSKLDKIAAMLGQGGAPATGTKDEADPPGEKEKEGPANTNSLGGADPDTNAEITNKDALPEELEAAMSAKTNDSAALETSFRAVLADAEILVPGFRLPAFDKAAKRKATLDSLCALRRGVLNTLMSTADGARLAETVNGGQLGDLSKMSCVGVATVFKAAAGAKRLLNNSTATRDAQRLPGHVDSIKPTVTPAQLNKLYAEYYSKQAH